VQHAYHSPAERARILSALAFPENYPNLNATWNRLKARFPRLCAHLGSVRIDKGTRHIAHIALVDDEAHASGAPTFPMFPAPRAFAPLLRDSKGPRARLNVHPNLEHAGTAERTAILCHELTHLVQLMADPAFTVRYSIENLTVGYFANRFEAQARLIGTRRGVREMCPMPATWATSIAREHEKRQRPDRIEVLPDYDCLAREIRKLRRGSRRRA
jgi:hypothetical protein